MVGILRKHIFRTLLPGLAGLCLALVLIQPGLAQERLKLLAFDWPPFAFQDPQDGLPGLDIEIVGAALAQEGITVEYVFLPRKRATRMVAAGETPGVISCSFLPERQRDFLYSNAVSGANRGFYVRRDYAGPILARAGDARGMSVGAVTGYATEAKLREIGITADPSPNDQVAIRKLLEKRIDLFYTVRESTDYHIKDMNLSDQLRFYYLYQVDYHVCFSRKWPGAESLADRLNAGLLKLYDSDIYDRIREKYGELDSSS